MIAIISFGSNMGDRHQYIGDALFLIEKRVGKIRAVSDVVETKAYGYTDQADFLNGAVSVDTELQPRQLLEALHEIEAQLDRVRLIRWGPRTIDLDIIFYGDRIIDEEDLHIPHIDFMNRRFVLEPICQIEPEWIDPRSGETVSALLDALRRRENEGKEEGKKEEQTE